MKKTFLLWLFLMPFGLIAQETIHKIVPFKELKVYDQISAELIQSNEDKIVINGSKAKEVEVIQKEHTLKIRMPFPKLLKGEDISVKIYYTQKIKEIEAYEGSFITAQKPLAVYDLEIEAKEGAEIRLEVDVNELEVKVTKGAMITLEGSVKGLFEAKVITGGVLQAGKLQARRANASVQMGGEVILRAEEHVKARVKAGGSIHIYGKPAYIDKQTLAGGTIEEME